MHNNIFRAVAFDMDGLMFDTEDTYWKAASALLTKRGEVYTDELCRAVMGRPPQACFELFKATFNFPETWQELQRESEDLFLQFLDDGFSTMPGLETLLQYLEGRHIPKGICTSSAVRVVSEVLKRKNLAERFDFILTAEDITQGKPSPEIYLKAAERFGITPSEMIVLEDSEAGCEAAAAAGAFGVIILAQHNVHGNFAAAKLIADSLDDERVLTLI
ncbi:MAG: HAD family phosphatase [Planctomycetaceae bacterium]|jgi:HAD superfamily hydrolase (TIGR01509 family)|nr:HAD family phosphatase [Planctomycetaceae bacterium]